ncbi:hypothetical protein ACJZ2D_000202 [Fusarium nematophilum]
MLLAAAQKQREADLDGVDRFDSEDCQQGHHRPSIVALVAIGLRPDRVPIQTKLDPCSVPRNPSTPGKEVPGGLALLTIVACFLDWRCIIIISVQRLRWWSIKLDPDADAVGSRLLSWLRTPSQSSPAAISSFSRVA